MSQIRGLINFIGDIRNCKTHEEERERVDKELAKIRACFSKRDVGSYNKKKYMWKIMYMYMLGYTVGFGHMQCVDLISCEKYSEKNVGYVGVSLLLIEHTDLLRLCIQTIKKDLNSRNEIFQCLALTCIANVGGVEFSESLTEDVQHLLISQTSRNFVRKKAALCLLRLLRQYPDNIPAPSYAPQVIKLAEHRNVGVVLSVMSLLTGLATYDPSNYAGVVPVAIRLLHQFVIQRECSKEYIYYRTPCPWLQVKLLRVLQYYPPPPDKGLVNKLHDILDRIVTKTEVTQSVNKNNADHAILFEAINVIIHLNIHGEDMLHDRAIHQLQKFIAVKEGNIRYLGLDAMARLAKIANTHKLIKKHLRTIQYSLDDNDISIRKRALDLLYSICDQHNVVEIIDHLLRYLSKAEYAIREEMVLKIAILAEKFGTDYQWYINVVLQLITVAGDFVTQDVWHRVVQIVTNQEDLQQYAAEMVYENLQEPPVHESLVKVAGYVLGEFGHLLDVEGKTQFVALHKHFATASLDTKALLLSTYMKFANMYEDLSASILPIFEQFKSSVDPEIQQRAVEYQVMATYDNQDLISQVWEAMPDFPERESNLMKLIKAKEGLGAADRDPFSDDDEEKDSDEDEDDEDEDEDEDEDDDEDEEEPQRRAKATAAPPQQAPPMQEDLLSGLFDSTPSGGASGVTTLEQDAATVRKLLTQPSAVLYEDSRIQIGVKCQVDFGGTMKMLLFFGNKSPSDMENMSLELEQPQPGLNVQFNPTGAFRIPGKQQLQRKCRAQIMQPLMETPRVRVQFTVAGQSFVLLAKLPVVATKFLQPHPIDPAQFRQRWSQLGKEKQQVVQLSGQWSGDKLRGLLSQGLSVQVISGVDANPNNSVGCAIYHFAAKRNDNFVTMPILLRLELNPQANAMRVTVHSPHDGASQSVLNAFVEIFS